MSETAPSRPAHPLTSLPIFWQVLGLSLVVLVLALGINTLIVLKAPEPPPSGYSLREVVTALKSGEVNLQNGRKLIATTTSSAPAYVTQTLERERPRRFERIVAARLAADLHVPADTVWIKFAPHPFHTNWSRQFYLRGPGGHAGDGPGPDGPGPDGPRPDGPPPTSDNDPSQNALPQTAPPPDRVPPDRMGFEGGPFDGGPPPFEREPNLRVAGGTDNRADVFYPSFSAAWKLADGRYRVITPPRDFIQPWQVKLLAGFGLTALLILPLAWLLARQLTRPIIAFSEAAAKVGFEDNAPPVLAVGSREVRAAADVLNAMQARIRKQMESRTAQMGAIAHDLKTPLARMRLRIEDLPGPLREKLSQDIGHMDGLIRSAMSFTSAHKLGETLRPLDISALVEALAEDMSAVCPMDAPLIEHNVMVRGDTVALKRILTNLIENACRYAGHCRIEVSTRGADVEIAIIDNGPGLPPEALETVFEPFYRLEESRNRDTGGTGLGLSVAKALAEAQGGALRLINRYEGAKVTGLEARLSLPRLTLK